ALRPAAMRAAPRSRPGTPSPPAGAPLGSGWPFPIRCSPRSPGGVPPAGRSAPGSSSGAAAAAGRSRPAGRPRPGGQRPSGDLLPKGWHAGQFPGGGSLSPRPGRTPMELRGSAVIITGASRGLGAALAEALGGAGARLVLVSRDGEALGKVVERIRAQGGEAHAVVADVSAPDSASRIAGTSAALIGPAEVVIHNAGTLGPVPLAPLADTSDGDF